MTTTPTSDIEQTIAQINELANEGVDLVRVGVRDDKELKALPELVKLSPVPLIADIHFSHKYVIQAIESGIAGVRVNPGNIRNFEIHGPEIVAAAKQNQTPLRIGVNAGSIDPDILQQFGDGKPNPKVNAETLVQSALKEAKLFEDLGFQDFKISIKHHDPLMTIEAYQKLSQIGPWPLHLGITEAGLKYDGIIKSVSALSILLSQGIGDTIRISLTDNPIEEVRAGVKLLQDLNLRPKGLEIISCPTCSRTQVELIKIAQKVKDATANLDFKQHFTLAVMGCEVNGPGEAKDADLGVACGVGIGKIFQKGKVIKTVPEDQIVPTLLSLLP